MFVNYTYHMLAIEFLTLERLNARRSVTKEIQNNILCICNGVCKPTKHYLVIIVCYETCLLAVCCVGLVTLKLVLGVKPVNLV